MANRRSKSTITCLQEDQLTKFISSCLQEAVDNASKQAVEYLTNYITDNWYKEYEPRRYQRTFDFLNSASKTETTISGRNGNSVVCMLYFDTKKIIPRYYGPEYLNPHASRDGASVAEYIPKWIEDGGWFHGRGKVEGLGSMEATIKMLEKNFPKMVQNELKKMGLKVKVSGK